MSQNQMAALFGQGLVKTGDRETLAKERDELGPKIAVRLEQRSGTWAIVIRPESHFERDVIAVFPFEGIAGVDVGVAAMARDLRSRGFEPE